MKETVYKGATIIALGHDGFRVELASPNVSFAFDPYDLYGEIAPVDFIFITHPHFDHCDVSSIRKLLKTTTKIVAPQSCAEELREFVGQLEIYQPPDKVTTGAITYWTIPAYNLDKFRTPSEVFHPKELGGVGFVVEVLIENAKNLRFYHAGDTDLIPEMAAVKKIDVAFLPISGTFVMTLDEAIKAAELIEPDLVIPMHYGKLLGSVSDAYRFQNKLGGKVAVAILSTETEDFR